MLKEMLEARRFIVSGEAKCFDENVHAAEVEDYWRTQVESLVEARDKEIRFAKGVNEILHAEWEHLTAELVSVRSENERLRASMLSSDEATALLQLESDAKDFFEKDLLASGFAKMRAVILGRALSSKGP